MIFALPDVGFLLPGNLREWSYLIFLGATGFIMQFLLAAGLQAEKSSRATNMTYFAMIFALVFDKLIFDTVPGLLSIAGSSLIMGSAIYVALQKQVVKPLDEGNFAGAATAEEEMGLVDGMDPGEGEETELSRI